MCNRNSNLPQSVTDKLAELRKMEETHFRLIAAILEADGGREFPLDFLARAVVNRSLYLIEGFAVMVELRNYLCAAPLIRLQLDSVLRFFATSLVDDPHAIALQMLAGQQLGRLKSKDGQRLTDRYLHEQLTKLYPWASSVYERTSGLIHLSDSHLLAPATEVDEAERTVTWGIGRGVDREWKEEEMCEAVDAFNAATKALLNMCASWFVAKRKAGEERARHSAPAKTNR